MIDIFLKKEFKIFVAIFMVSYLIINWSDISWIFNYKVVSGFSYDFFNPYQDTKAYNLSVPMPTIPNILVNQNNELSANNQEKINDYIAKPLASNKINILEIPAILLETEIVFPETTNTTVLHDYLDKGVIYYPGSAVIGTKGQSIFLGHSAPPNWPKIKHDWVFSNLEKLKTGDEIIVNLDSIKYIYKVKDKKIIDKGQEIENNLTYLNNVLVLVSCYPPGKDFQRIVVYAEIETN